MRIDALLHKAGLPSINGISIRAVAMETWKCFASRDGSNGDRNPQARSYSVPKVCQIYSFSDCRPHLISST
ncbi:Hypothetical protein FKW44_003469 [Caligus rogercresseyi]|uniref:Uncharacterized protein n=1 Tax=Caligus rogercresseyi TaxID=217165 RepID=A0A7T8KLQ0_CALRO|nr:Hypothetical protein FKW44_003469 [Caligus rogercresseyi]